MSLKSMTKYKVQILCEVSECFSSFYLQSHYQVKLSCTRGHRRLEPIPAVTGRMQETPWTGLMLITGLTYRDKKAFSHVQFRDASECNLYVLDRGRQPECQEGTHAGRTLQTLHREELWGEDANCCILLSPLIHLNILNQDYVHVSEMAHSRVTFLKKWFGLCENQDRRALQLLIIVSKILLID